MENCEICHADSTVEYTCHVCDGTKCECGIDRCKDCKNWTCDACWYKCEKCSDGACKSCITPCAECGGDMCRACDGDEVEGRENEFFCKPCAKSLTN